MRQAVATSPPGGRDRSGHAEQPLSRWSGSGVEGDLGDPEIAIRSGVLKREHVLDSRLREPPRTTNEIAPRPGDAEKPHRLTCSRLQPINRAPRHGVASQCRCGRGGPTRKQLPGELRDHQNFASADRMRLRPIRRNQTPQTDAVIVTFARTTDRQTIGYAGGRGSVAGDGAAFTIEDDAVSATSANASAPALVIVVSVVSRRFRAFASLTRPSGLTSRSPRWRVCSGQPSRGDRVRCDPAW